MPLVKLDKFDHNNLMTNAFANFVITDFLNKLLISYNFIESEYRVSVNNNDEKTLLIRIKTTDSLIQTAIKLKKESIIGLLEEEIKLKINTKESKAIDLKVIMS